jgi:hypothetical protein
MPFEGAKLVINKSLNNGFQVSHSVTMSSLTPSGYRFGATYIGCNMVSYRFEGICGMNGIVILKWFGLDDILLDHTARSQFTAYVRHRSEW